MGTAKTASLRSLATAVPKEFVRQDDAAKIAESWFGRRSNDFHRLKPVFVNAGIDRRALARPVEWYLEKRDWQERTDVYLQVADELFVESATAALDAAELKANQIDAIVTVSSTGIATPTLEARSAAKMGFRPDTVRTPVFGLGCAGGVTGLSLATRLALSEPITNVLLVVVELCSIAFRSDTFTKSNLIATALFGDGAAAAVVSTASDKRSWAGRQEISLRAGREHMWPGTLGIMGWNVDPTGFEVVFDKAIPPFAREHLRPVVDGFLDTLGISESDLARHTFHPGGTKVLEALEDAFEMPPKELNFERDILRDYGNMSAPTVLFVLEKLLQSGFSGTTLLTALGPGFTASCIPAEVSR